MYSENKTPMRANKTLLEERNELTDRLNSFERKTQGRAITAAEQREWDTLFEKIQGVNAELAAAERYRQGIAARAGGKRPPAAPTSPLVAAARALFGGKTTKVDEQNVGEFFDLEKRAINSTSGSDTIQNPFLSPAASVIFDPIYNSVITQLGVDVFDLEANYFKYPKVSGYPVLAVYGEADVIPVADPTITSVQFDVKNYGVLVKVHNNVLRDAGEMTDAIIQGVFMRAIEQMFLTQALYGASASGQFVGLDTAAGVQTVAGGGAILANYDLIVNAVEKALSANADPSKIAAIMHPKVWAQLQKAKDSTGQMLALPSGLAGYPLLNSTAVKTNYGVGTNETKVYVGDFSTVKLGVEGRYEMRLDQTFAASDTTAFALVVRADMQLFHPEQIARIDAVATA